ncbi:hypothetical protein BN11_4980003 [Nostocoides australiense Ben110]|uniref:Uncharacterized protein n=1 Tax=Nostocoides australiense Ben110 TaxID=1193182 RepID=W6K4F6_9MICO|nr:hypothetical protein BN11_4980003 [Tetrasphaera australiensis Ben110]
MAGAVAALESPFAFQDVEFAERRVRCWRDRCAGWSLVVAHRVFLSGRSLELRVHRVVVWSARSRCACLDRPGSFVSWRLGIYGYRAVTDRDGRMKQASLAQRVWCCGPKPRRVAGNTQRDPVWV